MANTVFFGRKVRFTAGHHYALAGESVSSNRSRFGSASEMHEHEWELTIWLKAPVDAKTGMMVDLEVVDAILNREVVTPFHQKHINTVDDFFVDHQPTTEVLASYFAEKLTPHFRPVQLVRLRIAESPDLFAEWHL